MKKPVKYTLIMLFAATSTLSAEANDTGYHKHDGFFLNLMAGFGFLNYDQTVDSDKHTIKGFGSHFGVKMGKAITNQLVVFGAFDGFGSVNPTSTYLVNGVTTSSSTTNTIYVANMFGAGLAFYTQSNFFFAGTVGYASAVVTQVSGSSSTYATLDGGFGATVNVGREWWVSKNWGIGAALVGHYSRPSNAGNPITQLYGGVSVTATYN